MRVFVIFYVNDLFILLEWIIGKFTLNKITLTNIVLQFTYLLKNNVKK